MNKEICKLVIEYLKSEGANVTESSGQAVVQLTEQLDRKFMNRPFYWYYRDAVCKPGDPLQVMIVHSPSPAQQKEIIQIYPDHPVFLAMFNSAQNDNRFFIGYEQSQPGERLFPWILIHLTAETVPPGSPSHRVEGRLSLTTGQTAFDVRKELEEQKLTDSRPNGSILLTNKIPYATSLNMLNQKLEAYIEKLFVKTFIHDQLSYQKAQDNYIQTHHISAGLIYLRSP
ncbi:YqhG family protein [Jeotgalibacillus sp. JSM ZJ347]|uniref:YqhG family protein n=1 Tax=Jeotgalibacillus sp. JSM ZJ347 TaxID=3342117 RepID=UPI0035A8D8A3